MISIDLRVVKMESGRRLLAQQFNNIFSYKECRHTLSLSSFTIGYHQSVPRTQHTHHNPPLHHSYTNIHHLAPHNTCDCDTTLDKMMSRCCYEMTLHMQQ
mmetsp:Transcript_38042/g.77702  ORF Transcript_38042/g.77702 Transcript_38042/m.77702 type:complete len:100 (-) Transcript_38042:676-975(-)